MPSGGDRGARPRTSTPRYRVMPVDPPNTRSGRYANNPNRPNTTNPQPNQNDSARGSPQQPRPPRPVGPQILHSIAAEIIARGSVPGGGLNPIAGGGAGGGASRNTRGPTANQTPGVDTPTTPSRPPVAGGVPAVGGTPNSRQGNAADAGRPAGAPSATPAAGSVTVPPVLPVPPTRPNTRGQGDSGMGPSHGPIGQQGGTTPDLDETVLQSLAPSINETMSGRRRVLNQSSDTGSHSSDWDHSGDIGAGNGNRRRNRRRGNGTYSELADTVTNLTTVLAGAQSMWEQRYNLLDEKLNGVESRHEDERLNLAGRLETLSGHLRNALGQVQNDNETQQTWNVETRERLRRVESTLEGVTEQVSATSQDETCERLRRVESTLEGVKDQVSTMSRDETPLLGASDANRDALRDLNRKIQIIGTNLDKVNQKADNIRGDLNHQVNDTQQAITGFRSDVAAVNTIATDLQGAMNDLNTIRNSVNDLTVEQATLRRLDTDMTAVKRGVQDNTRQLDRYMNDLRLSVNTLRDQFSTTHESCNAARLLQDRVTTLNNEFRVFLRALEGQGIVPPGTFKRLH